MTENKKRYVHFAIMLILTLAISICPPAGQITPFGMKALGVFVGVLYGWIFIDLVWPSIFGFVALALANIMPVTTALSTGFGNQMFLMMFIVIALAGTLEEAGLADFLSTWLLRKKFFRKSPWLLIIGLCLIAYVLGMASASVAACILLWTIFLHSAELCGISKKDPLISFCIFVICIAAFGGNLTLPFAAGAAIFLGFFTQATQFSVPYIPFIIYAFTITASNVILLLLFGKCILKIDASKLVLPKEVADELDNKEVTQKQKISMVILIIYLTTLLLPELAPSLPGMTLLSQLGLVGVSIIAILTVNFISVKDAPMVDLAHSFSKHMPWPLLLLLAVTFPLAEALKAEDSGIMPTIAQAIAPLISNLGVIPFMIVTLVILGLLTQVTHNIVLGAMFIPFLCPLIATLGGNPYTMFFIIFFSLQAAYATPAGSAQAAMVHGHECMQRKYAYLLGFVNLAIVCLILAIIGIPLGDILFK